MKCTEIDFIQYIEGQPTLQMKQHILQCPTCQEELTRFSTFLKIIVPAYRKGCQHEVELDRYLADMDLSSMKSLPRDLARKIKAKKEKNLKNRLKNLFAGSLEDAQEVIDGILNPQMEALPASPKDITKTKKDKAKQQKVSPKRKTHKKSK